MEITQERVKSIVSKFNDKQSKKLGLTSLENLPLKLLEKDITDKDVESLLNETISLLEKTIHDEKPKYKDFKTKYNELKKLLRTKYQLIKKDDLITEYTGIGIAIGVAIGAAFTTINPAFIGIGLPIGLAIGVGIGTQKEKEAEEKGNIY